ncbi:Rieske 2Fe-2S domain-containing protein, partial [bacterium]|nr:Rieske 2Fe-2S domain-containing protein [bacterium]
MPEMIPLCNTKDLVNSGIAVPFDVVYSGQTCSAFAVRFKGTAVAYLNRCAHVAMEMDYQPNRFFDTTGQWLMCATHGATYA